MTVVIQYPHPGIPLIRNPREARADRARAVRLGWEHSWRTLTKVYLLEQIHGAPTDVPGPAVVSIEIPSTTTHQRCPAPFIQATADAMVAGLIDAACWPDPTTVDVPAPILRPAHHIGLWTDPLVTIRITPTRSTR